MRLSGPMIATAVFGPLRAGFPHPRSRPDENMSRERIWTAMTTRRSGVRASTVRFSTRGRQATGSAFRRGTLSECEERVKGRHSVGTAGSSSIISMISKPGRGRRVVVSQVHEGL